MCSGSKNPLPAISDNGIKGSWYPNFQSNKIGKIRYTFIPDDTNVYNTVSFVLTIRSTNKAIFSREKYTYNECEGFTMPVPVNGVQGNWTVSLFEEGIYLFTPFDKCGEPTSIQVMKLPKTKFIFKNLPTKIGIDSEVSLPKKDDNGFLGSWKKLSESDKSVTYKFHPISMDCYEPYELVLKKEVSQKQNTKIESEDLVYNFVSRDNKNKLIFDYLDASLPNEVFIYDEMGSEVFYMKNYNNSERVFKGYGNKGSYLGENKPLSPGVYFYVIDYQYKDENGTLKRVKKQSFLYLN